MHLLNHILLQVIHHSVEFLDVFESVVRGLCQVAVREHRAVEQGETEGPRAGEPINPYWNGE